MQRWLQRFSLEQIHIVDGDQLMTDPYVELKKIEKYLGLRQKVSRQSFYHNKTKGFVCLAVNRRDSGCLTKAKGHKPPPIKPEKLQMLRSYFTPLNIQFYKQIHKNFTW